jgi:anti-sigma regulatory factor (Ser/Thr protein kinase)
MRRLDIRTGVFEVQTAVDEACTNIINYAYSGKGGMITLTCERQDDDFVVTIRDNGKPFDPASVSLPDLEADLDKRKIGGLGLYLMKKLMDDVSYSFDAKEGNTLVMRKKITGEKPER